MEVNTSSTLESFLEQMAMQIFINAVLDAKTQRALRRTRQVKLESALAYELKFKTAKKAFHGHARVQNVETGTQNRTNIRRLAVKKREVLGMWGTRSAVLQKIVSKVIS